MIRQFKKAVQSTNNMIIIENKLSYSSDTLVMGAGLAGLTTAYQLAKSGRHVMMIEKNKQVGGLARTINENGFRFDLGGHRFITQDKVVDDFVKTILNGDYLVVPRTSKILLDNKYFHYPLKPMNSILSLGAKKSLKVLVEYLSERIKKKITGKQPDCLEDWVIQQFGKTMFELYFKDYSEKVWGIDCKHIAKEWIVQRIQGLSLGAAIKNALCNKNDDKYTTLVDRFIYPHKGIGAIADNLCAHIASQNEVLTGTSLLRLNHAGNKIKNAVVKQGNKNKIIEAQDYVSSIPVSALVSCLNPAPPGKIQQAVKKLRYRSLLLVTIMLDQDRVTDQTWIYFPEKNIPFGRIHEPTNWSAKMAPPGKTLLVAEYFCFEHDAIWHDPDEQLTGLTIRQLHKLHLIDKHNVLGARVIRVPYAYPLFETGFQQYYELIADYLAQFDNLFLTGRTGKFKYYNMDHTIGSGMEVAQHILQKNRVADENRQYGKIVEGAGL